MSRKRNKGHSYFTEEEFNYGKQSYINLPKLSYKSESQKIAHEQVRNNLITFLGGEAGTGKSFLACYEAIKDLNEGKVEKIIITRPMVEAGSPMGFLPGTANEKIYPYLIPLLDNFEQIIGPNKLEELLDSEIIKFEPINYLRGRTLRNSFVIIDEIQNCKQLEMKLILTRIGEGSKYVIAYDENQVDIKNSVSCIHHIPYFFGKKNIGNFTFKASDVIRSEMAKIVVEAYQEIENDLR